MSQFPILGAGVSVIFFFHFSPNFNRNCMKNSEANDQTLHYAVSDLGLHCLPMSHKKECKAYIKAIINLIRQM